MTDKNNAQNVHIYQECLQTVLSFYDVQADLRGVLETVPIASGHISPADLIRIGERLGFKVQKVKVPFSKTNKLNAPAVLDLGDNACAYMPEHSDSGHFCIPKQDGKEISLNDIAKSYTGFCYIFLLKDQASAVDLSHIETSHALDWFWNPLISFWDRYAEVLVATTFINILALAIPLYTLNIYDRVVVNFVEDTLVVLTIGVITAIVFDFFFKTIRIHIVERIAVKVSTEYDVKLMERMLNIKDVDLHLTTGEKANLFRELQGIKDFYAARLVPTLVDIPFFLLFTLVIYLIAPELSMIPIVAGSLVLLLNWAAQSLITRYTAQYFTAIQGKSAHLVEMLSGLSTIRTLGAVGPKLFKWQQITHNSSKAACYNNLINHYVSHLSALITQIGQICVVFFGAYLIYDGSLTVGALVACSIIYGRSIAPIVTLATVLSRLKQSNDVLKTIDSIFQLPNDEENATSKGAKGPFNGKVQIKDLTYQYPDQANPALYKVNLDIAAGEHVGLIGKTGAGKSTLCNIIIGMISPGDGQIFLDDYTYESIANTELRRSIGYVPQEGHFFAGSMLENIIMGNDTISKDALERAIHLSGLDLVMTQTAEGLDMDVGEGGKRLSGGQKQALSLARAFARDPQILVFDEPTTGMDSALEHRVKQAIHEFTQNRTFIMITHRTTLLPLVSRLVLLDKGRIVADGSRDEIIKKLSNS